jgi:hypothetical protein
MDAPERQLDFWVGEWDVYDPDGKHVHRSRIESTTGGRVILENWSGDGGLVGSSMNFYDAEDGRWHQTPRAAAAGHRRVARRTRYRRLCMRASRAAATSAVGRAPSAPVPCRDDVDPRGQLAEMYLW